MNKQRRKETDAIICELEIIAQKIEQLGENEQEYFDNMPENLQYSEKGEAAEQSAGYYQDAFAQVEEIVDFLTSAIE